MHACIVRHDIHRTSLYMNRFACTYSSSIYPYTHTRAYRHTSIHTSIHPYTHTCAYMQVPATVVAGGLIISDALNHIFIVAGPHTSRVRWPVPATGTLEVGAHRISE
jgi:hypothetical protein